MVLRALAESRRGMAMRRENLAVVEERELSGGDG